MIPFGEMRRLVDEVDGLGLNWTAEGPLLAGAPLLRTTLTGMAPRPANEVTALVAGAYGHCVDPSKVLRSLDVIAAALNKGDCGRAMIAALRLRLPPISWDGAVQIAHIEQRLTKYNPDEPRDAHGRWTTEAGSNSINSKPMPKLTVRLKPVSRPKPKSKAKPKLRVRSPVSTEAVYQPLEGERLRPILISDREPANDNIPRLPAGLISMMMARECIHNARDPDYQTKVEECVAAHEKCNGLVIAGERDIKLQGYCNWPDGASAIIRGGMLIPISPGHPF